MMVIPGIVAFHLFAADEIQPDHAYGQLVKTVLPAPMAGFFAAALVGAILSSFNSALNSTATLFSLGVYKHLIKHDATDDAHVIRVGKIFGAIIAVVAMIVAPMLAGQASIFDYLQKMNGLYAVPIFSVVLIGLLNRRVPALAANIALIAGFVIIALVYFVPDIAEWASGIHGFHFLGIVFALLVGFMLIMAKVAPRETPWEHRASGQVDLTPWKYAKPVGIGLVVVVLLLFITFADVSAL